MRITGVNPLPSFGENAVGGAAAATGEAFGSSLRGALDKLEKSQQNADLEIAKAVSGESPDLHRTVIALQTADLTFQLALQIRNKVINAYEEVMRMQV